MNAPAPALQTVGDGEDLLTVQEVAIWLDVSRSFLDNGRSKGFGPKALTLENGEVRYRRRDVVAYVEARAKRQAKRKGK